MTGPAHYREAERLIALAEAYEGLPNNSHVQIGQIAQVHATLALAAATVNGAMMHPSDLEEWDRVIA